MASKWWPDSGLAPPDQFFTAGADDDIQDDESTSVQFEEEEGEAGGDTNDESGSEPESIDAEDGAGGGDEDDFDDDFKETTAACGFDDTEGEEGDEMEIGKGKGKGKGRQVHPRMVYVFGSVSGLHNSTNAPISTKKLPRLVVTSTSFKGAAKKLMTALGRHILGLKKGAVMRGKRNQSIKFSKLQLFRVRKVGAERLARLLDAPSSSHTALMARLAQIDPAKSSPKAFVRLNHKYNGVVTFLSEENAQSSKIRQKNTTIRVQVKIKSDAARHKNMNFLHKK